jgi:hypothetical protein
VPFGAIMKSLFFILLSTSVWAANLNCTIEEFSKGRSQEQVVVVNLDPDQSGTEDPHGRMEFFKLQNFTQYEGFVAVVKETAVINVQTHDGNYGYSSTGNVIKGDSVSLQMLFPSEDENPSGILIQCSVKK